jgi:hypothetical protein
MEISPPVDVKAGIYPARLSRSRAEQMLRFALHRTVQGFAQHDIARSAGIYSAEPADRKNVRERAGGEK